MIPVTRDTAHWNVILVGDLVDPMLVNALAGCRTDIIHRSE